MRIAPQLRLRPELALTLCATLVGCGADRTTGPDEATRAADEFERAAAEMAFAGGPTAALTYQSAASALRGGVRASQVEITVNGKTESWNAFGHEMHIRPPTGAPSGVEPRPLRAFLAWRVTSSGVRVIHLMAAGDDGDIRGLFPTDPIDIDLLASPSYLMYAEGRNAMWEGVSGHQKSLVTASSTPCPQPRARPAGPVPSQTCVEASFTFELTGVEARPFVPPFGVVTPIQNLATGTRTISMRAQSIAGVQVTLTLPAFPVGPLVGQPLP